MARHKGKKLKIKGAHVMGHLGKKHRKRGGHKRGRGKK